MTIEAIVARYGIAALFAGAALEGEAAVIAGGILAHQGMWSLPAAMLAATTGSFLADQLWFLGGRRMQSHRWVQAMRRRSAFAKALEMLERHPIGFIFAFRFIYGFRTISPIAIGTTNVSQRLFSSVNAAAAVIWAVTFSTIGYLFGDAFEAAFGRLKHDPRLWWIVGGFVILGAIVGLIHWRRTRTA